MSDQIRELALVYSGMRVDPNNIRQKVEGLTTVIREVDRNGLGESAIDRLFEIADDEWRSSNQVALDALHQLAGDYPAIQERLSTFGLGTIFVEQPAYPQHPILNDFRSMFEGRPQDG